MIVTCPSCSSKYIVQAELIGVGKLVRCAVCGTVWNQEPIDEKAVNRQRFVDVVKWTLFYATVFSSVSMLVFGRDFVMSKWPASESFYEFVRMQKNGNCDAAFSLRDVSYFFIRKHGDLYIGLRGELCNNSTEVKHVPSIAISLKTDPESSRSSFKKNWVHKLQYEKLLPSQKVLFETKLQRVPVDNLLCNIKLNSL